LETTSFLTENPKLLLIHISASIQVSWQRVNRDLEPRKASPVILPAGTESIDTFFRTEGRSPAMVPNQAKLAITDGTARTMSQSPRATRHEVSFSY